MGGKTHFADGWYIAKLQRERDELKAQVASLRKDIQDADDLLTKGDNHGALVQVRMAASRASDSYLDYIARAAIPKVTQS